MCLQTYNYTHTHMHIYTQTHTHTHTHTRTQTYTDIHKHTHKHTHTHRHARTHPQPLWLKQCSSEIPGTRILHGMPASRDIRTPTPKKSGLGQVRPKPKPRPGAGTGREPPEDPGPGPPAGGRLRSLAASRIGRIAAAAVLSTGVFAWLYQAQRSADAILPELPKIKPKRQSAVAAPSASPERQAAPAATPATRKGLDLPECDKGEEVTPLLFGAKGNGIADDTKAVMATIEYGAHCKVPAVLGPSGKKFLMQPGRPIVVEDVTIRIEGRVKGPDLMTWNPRGLKWPAGSCAYREGAADCSKVPGLAYDYQRSHWALLHLVNSSDVRIEGSGGRLSTPGKTFWEVRNKNAGIRGYSLLKIERSARIRVMDLMLLDSPMFQVVVASSRSVHLERLKLQISDDQLDTKGPHNTDGIVILNSTRVTVRDCLVESGDDNIVVKEGSRDIQATGLTLRRGKGLSIEIGERPGAQTIKDIFFGDFKLEGCMFAVRLKTWQNADALISNATFQNFLLEGVLVGMAIEQKYCPSSQRVEGCEEDAGKFARVESTRFLDFSGDYAKKEAELECPGCEGLQRLRVIVGPTAHALTTLSCNAA